MNRDIEMMKNPMKWPQMVLPVVHRIRSIHEQDNCGILFDSTPIVYLINMFDLDRIDLKTVKLKHTIVTKN